jgi:hypothetical protein
MRHLIVVLSAILTGCNYQSPRPRLEQVGNSYSYEYTGRNAAYVHAQAANTFTRLLGEELKHRWPSKPSGLTLELDRFKLRGQFVLRYRLSVQLVPTTPSDPEAVCYIDHRGALMFGSTLAEARNASIEEIALTNKIGTLRRSFNRVYGQSHLYQREAATGSDLWLYVREYFATARPRPGHSCR